MELAFYLRPLLALVFVLVLMLGIAWLLKKFNVGQRFLNQSSGQRLIAIEETQVLDMKRRLVLVRCGNVGHLLLLGANADLVVETNIELEDSEEVKSERVEQGVYGHLASEPEIAVS